MQTQSKTRKPYRTPAIRRVRLEDKRVVAMAACNQFLDVDGGHVDGDNVVDRYGNLLLTYDPSL